MTDIVNAMAGRHVILRIDCFDRIPARSSKMLDVGDNAGDRVGDVDGTGDDPLTLATIIPRAVDKACHFEHYNDEIAEVGMDYDNLSI